MAGADAKVIDAWKRMGNLGSSKVVVAVIDNGFDVSHPDLRNKVYRPFDLWTQSDRLTEGDISFTHGTPCASLAVAAANGALDSGDLTAILKLLDIPQGYWAAS